ncbi:hypothetical protein BJY01DRAFT_150276 [Aspergillus pseudoustus]|uniref:Uncharacterized protein n=1 Tax=Aspergillus pseudoustus TaxID=1810923 RepID=A0ABR4IH46_9EURO
MVTLANSRSTVHTRGSQGRRYHSQLSTGQPLCLQDKFVDGQLVHRLDYDLTIIFGAQDGVLKFEARANGGVIGHPSIDFAKVFYY